MINVSNDFRQELQNNNRKYLCYANITLKDNTVLDVDNSDLLGFSVEDATSNADSFDISSVIINQATLSINNITEKYSEYDFDQAKVILKVGLELPNGTIETIDKGTFYVDDPKYNTASISLTCLDNIRKFDKEYTLSKLSYPTTLGAIVRDACNVCGVTLATATFDNDDFVVKERPTDDAITFRQVLLWVGQIACVYWKCNKVGALTCSWYDRSIFEENVLDGGEFDESTPYATGDDADGGNLTDYSSGDSVNGGTFVEQRKKYHHIYSISSQTICTDDVVITGIKVTEYDSEDNATQVQVGEDGYVLSVDGNKLIRTGDASKVAEYIGNKIIGMRFRSLSISCLSDPTIESGDCAYVTDRKQRTFDCYVTNTKFTVGSYQTLSCDAKTPTRNSATRFSQATQAYVESQKQLEKEKTQRELAQEQFQQQLDNASGMYTTEEEQPDGSFITYLHDKKTLAESKNVVKITSDAIGLSTDGGKTYPFGFTIDGDFITKILYAVGINADYITTGAFTVEKYGQVLFNADKDTGRVDIVADSFSLQGRSIEEISDKQINDFVDATLNPSLDNLQKQIDGQIETYYYDYQPTLYNQPAVEWTTETERAKHEGDLFYWKSKGYSYRFFKNGSVWVWQMVQDTDITKALEEASQAQDTADSKRRVFVSTPVPPYDVGDLWVQGVNGDIMRCQYARVSGIYSSYDWVKASKYTDDTAVEELDQSLNQQDIFNRLTNNGQTQGIYLQGGKLYINASYINSGTYSIINDGEEVVYMDADTGEVRMNLNNIKVSSVGTKIYRASDYTSYDNTIVREILEGTRELTIDYLEKYDVNGDGRITAVDYVKIRNMIDGVTGDQSIPLMLEIDGTSSNGIVRTQNVFIGNNGIWTKSLNCNSIISKQIGKILWSGELWPNESQTIQLSDDISNQFSGVVLHWQAYEYSSLQDYDHVYTFVPKTHVLRNSGRGISVFLSSGDLTFSGTKYIFVSDRYINGSSTNERGEYVTGSGIKSTPNHWALSEVIGV